MTIPSNDPRKYYLLLCRTQQWMSIWADSSDEAETQAVAIINKVNSRAILIAPDGYRQHLYPRTA